MSAQAGKKKADLKVIILGDFDVGKTSLICRYIEGKFQKQEPTVGAAFFLKQWGPYNIAVWDTAGDERYTGLSHFYCRSAGAAIMAFDLTSPKTFESLWARFGSILEAANEDCLKVIVGTKADTILESGDREISVEDGKRLAFDLNPSLDPKIVEAPYFETSALKNENVCEVFEYIFQRCLPLSPDQQKRYFAKNKSTIDLMEESPKAPNSPRQRTCCMK